MTLIRIIYLLWLGLFLSSCDETASESEHFSLHTVFREGPDPLSCSPDAGFLLNCRGYKRVIYLEQDRGTLHQLVPPGVLADVDLLVGVVEELLASEPALLDSPEPQRQQHDARAVQDRVDQTKSCRM